MTQQEFDELVQRLEHEASENPSRYKRKLAAFASLGYLYVFAVLLLLVLASAALVASLFFSRGLILLVKKLLIPILVLIGVVLKSLWVKLDPPPGLAIERKAYPKLFAMIDEVRSGAKAPKAHVVLLTDELNAAIVQHPRLGMFGWQKNYLILGLPLMQILSPDELKAVLAHEFGHLSGAHGRFGAWIYRIRAGWAQLNAALQQQRHWGSFMFVPFFGWFAPKFVAYSFVQARQQEYEADQIAAETVGNAALANALVRLDLKSQELEKSYWPGIYAAASREPEPTSQPFAGLLARARHGFMPDAGEQLRTLLERSTSNADTHPSLNDRTAALGHQPRLPPAITRSAAEALLGNELETVVAHFDQNWRQQVSGWWRERHDYAQRSREKLAAYRARPVAELDDDDLFEYGQLTEDFDEPAAAFDLYKQLAERGTKHASGVFAYGRMLLDRDDESGIQVLEALMSDNEGAVTHGCDVIVGYLHRHNREAEARPYMDRYYAAHEKATQAQVVRETLHAKDTWLPPSLGDESLAFVKKLLAAHPRVKSAYLVRKDLPSSEPPLHVLGLVRKSRMLKYESGAADDELVQEIANALTIGDEMLVIPLNSDNRAFTKRFKKVAGARLV